MFNWTNEFGISDKLMVISNEVEKKIKNNFERIDLIKESNQYKIIRAMQKNRLSEIHFAGTTGYGYGDISRDVLDNIFKDAFGAEDALVRQSITCGTHAISICLFGLLRPGDRMISATGKLYDTLDSIIGINGCDDGSLKEFGITYDQVELLDNGKINLEDLKNSICANTKLIHVQRSRGYNWRRSVSIENIRNLVQFIKGIRKDIIVMVDNCYGEFVEELEPTDVGADIAVGSLIKNPGGGLAPSGGYIVGTKNCINKIQYRLTTPGLGREVGSTLYGNRLLFQGLFMAPQVVSESIKGAIFCAELMDRLGFETSPHSNDFRSDIIQAIKFGNREKLITFCQGIQKGSAIDSFAVPEPWDMPGYESQVIMAAGCFVQGASIELSADAPIREPYICYMQGGLTYSQVKLSVLLAAQAIIS